MSEIELNIVTESNYYLPMQSSSFMKTPFKEIKNCFSDDTSDDSPEEKISKHQVTPQTLSSTNKKEVRTAYSSPPPSKKIVEDRSPPSEFNKKTSYLFRNGIIKSQQEYLDLD